LINSAKIWRIVGFTTLIILAVVFYKIVIYLTISSVLFLIGYPIVYKISSISFGKKKIPRELAALSTLLTLSSVIFFLFLMIIPPLVQQANILAELSFQDVMNNLMSEFPAFGRFISELGNENDFRETISIELDRFLNISNFSKALNNILSYAGSLTGGLFCILFITFFFLKDEKLIRNMFLLFTPTRYWKDVKEILNTTKTMLGKYFAGLFIDMLIIGTLAGVALSLFGIKNALIIGFTAGIMNAVPYIGPAITMLVAIFLGVSGAIAHGEYDTISIVLAKIFFTLMSINLLDSFVLQPLIYSNSVKAHPLEIFIVILMGATIAGIGGMIIAIPVYTILRIVARQFLNQFRFVDKITEGLADEKQE